MMDIKETTYYTIYQKTTDKKKIIAELFSNETLETINNFKKYMNDDWGYRIYIDESVNISLETINNLDFVELFILKSKNTTLLNNTKNIYHYHASTDVDKELVYIKDNTMSLDENFLLELKNFEDSNKIICGYLTPWYKPFVNTLSKFPFNIPSFFWGIKPKLYLAKYVDYHYGFDDIVECIIRFNNNPNILENNYTLAANEIILTELIFSDFKVKDIYFIVQKYDLNSILLFYIIYEELKNNDNFIKILEDNLNKNNINSLDCILPYYDQISDKKVTKIFYYAYLKTLYNIVENSDDLNDNINITWYSLITKYMQEQLPPDYNEIMHDIVKHIDVRSEYKFSLYYSTKIHISKLDTNKWKFIFDTVSQTFKNGLLNGISKELYDIFFVNNKKYFGVPLKNSIIYQLMLRMKYKIDNL